MTDFVLGLVVACMILIAARAGKRVLSLRRSRRRRHVRVKNLVFDLSGSPTKSRSNPALFIEKEPSYGGLRREVGAKTLSDYSTSITVANSGVHSIPR